MGNPIPNATHGMGIFTYIFAMFHLMQVNNLYMEHLGIQSAMKSVCLFEVIIYVWGEK